MASHMTFPDGASVRVRLIDTTTIMTIKAESFIKPVVKGHEILNITDIAFLIDHEKFGRVLFDNGCRKDFWNHPPAIADRLGDVIPGLKVEKDVSEILEDSGIDLQTINSIIWSHYHWDHTNITDHRRVIAGNVSLFPKSTSVTVGPGFKSKVLPGYPTRERAPILESDFAGRALIEISFDSGLQIGRFSAHDFFGDGSFYLLDTPGHCIGHMCGLARTTPDTFVFMGGDICHFSGDFRPNKGYPLPDPVPSTYLDKSSYFPRPCPCSLFTDHHPRVPASDKTGRITPFYSVTDHPKSAYVDPPTAVLSVNKMQEFDEAANVLVCIAHDPVLLEVLPVLNKTPEQDLKDWKRAGWKEKCHWGWLNELPRNGQPGRPPMVEGLVKSKDARL